MVQKRELTFTYEAPWEVVILSYEDKFWNVPNAQLPELLECQFSEYNVILFYFILFVSERSCMKKNFFLLNNVIYLNI